MNLSVPVLRWCGVDKKCIEKNIEQVVSENPLIKTQSDLRSFGRPLDRIRAYLSNNAKSFYYRSFNKYMMTSSQPDEDFEYALKKQITKELVLLHYKNMAGQTLNYVINTFPGQFWWIPNYYVCHQYYGRPIPGFLRENFFDDEFYGFQPSKGHPALVIKNLPNQKAILVPFTHTKGYNGKIPVLTNSKIGMQQSYAIYKFAFVASYAMLEGNDDGKNLTISTDDFDSICSQIKVI